MIDLGKAVSYHSKLKPEMHKGKSVKIIKFGQDLKKAIQNLKKE